jgi:hypothetical protein
MDWLRNMSSDILLPLSNGMSALVWADAVEITRQGTKPIPGGDKWRIALPLRASLADAEGHLILDDAGNEILVTPPITFPSRDVADYMHHPRVAALVAEIDAVTKALISGEITPAEPPIPAVEGDPNGAA